MSLDPTMWKEGTREVKRGASRDHFLSPEEMAPGNSPWRSGLPAGTPSPCSGFSVDLPPPAAAELARCALTRLSVTMSPSLF